MMTNKIKNAGYASLLVAIPLFQSCSDDDETLTTDEPTEVTVLLKESEAFGNIITDSEGKSLYFFSKDTKDTSLCTEECLDTSSLFYTDSIIVEDGLDSNDFSTITRTDGNLQTTYKGWPLYYSSTDSIPGDINGESDTWFIAKPNYSLMYAKAQLVGEDGNMYTSSYVLGEEETSYIVDSNGKTLYINSNDTYNTNTFTEADFSNNDVWPIAELTLEDIPSILNLEDFDTIDVYGRTQLTYKGWPLYYFGQDENRGDTKGISYPYPGAWPIANTDTPVSITE